MQLPKISHHLDLLHYINKTELYKALVKQLNKDFELIGTAVKFSSTETPQLLFKSLQLVIAELLQKHFDVFLNLLYRIDIDEKQIKKLLNTMQNDMEEQLSFLILKREWQKVWYQKYF